MPDTFHIIAPMTSSVWKMLVKVGDVIESGQILAILEAMKMEIRKLAGEASHQTLTKSLI